MTDRRHVFHSPRASNLANELAARKEEPRGHTYYKLDDGTVVEITEAKSLHEDGSTPSSNWDDAEYLGIGTYNHTVEEKDPNFVDDDNFR